MHTQRATRSLLLLFLLPLSLLPPATCAASTSDEVAALRKELEQTKALVASLEARLSTVEESSAQQSASQTEAVAAADTAAAASSPNAFNPAISAVLQGSYNAYSRNPDEVAIAGFAPTDAGGLPNEGFSLGESEVNLSSNIDQMFYGSMTVSLEDDEGSTETSLEEAYIETLALPWGTKIKAGKMFPVLGYLNEIHAHADAFVDRPLPYRVFLGGDNYADNGIQFSMLLPTDLYAEIGGGAYQGENYPASGSSNNGRGAQTLFARIGGDIGVSQSWLTGISYLHADATDRDTDGLVFSGTTPVYIADAKYTWAPDGNMANRSLVLQGEYFWNQQDGSYNDIPYDESSRGWYAQAVYKFASQWSVGYRFAYLTPPDVPPAFVGSALDSDGHDPRTQSLLLKRDFSEFSSLRLEYTHDDSDSRGDDEAFLNYVVSMGAHGAHKY